jgi:hypothetical protein
VTVDQVEQAAAPLSARMNCGAEAEPFALLHLEPTLESSAILAESAPEHPISLAEPAPEQSAILADSVTTVGSGLTTAETVAALTSKACRWPCGDPLHSDFRFCGGAVVVPPYCEEHRAVAYLAPPPNAPGATAGPPGGLSYLRGSLPLAFALRRSSSRARNAWA